MTIRVRPVAINILVGNEQPSYSFDLSGRLIGAFVDGYNYRRSLDGRVMRKWSAGDGRRRRWLGTEEAEDFVARVYALAEAVTVATGDSRLGALKGWTPARRAADVTAFQRIYRPVSILPPDQYLALVIQATEGCSYNRCTFCDFYRDRPFRIKSPDELRRHVEEVQDFFGAAIGLRKSLFLADANALVAPMPRIREWLDVIDAARARARPGRGLPGRVFSFIDAFDVGRKSMDEWRELANRGLRRVYIGMESGDDGLLQFLRKPGAAADVVDAVGTLKAAGVGVSVIVMVGAGGDRFAGGHVTHTVAALRRMPLAAGDIVYFSPFFDRPGSAYGERAAEHGVRPLSDVETARQEAEMREGLRGLNEGVQLSRYDIREFVY